MALERFRPRKANPDYTYLSLVALLVLFGLVMISSSSVVVSAETFGQNYSFVAKQTVALAIGIILAIITSRINYRTWQRLAPGIFIASLFLLLLVFLPGLGKTVHGATRWIVLGPIQVQPAEIVKFSFILYLAVWLEKKGPAIASLREGLLPFLALVVFPGLLILLQRDLGTFSVIFLTAGAMFVVAGASLGQIGLGGLIGAGLFYLLIVTEPYRLQRITAFLDPRGDTLGTSYHINQALLAVGSGGWWGKGFGQSLQKYLYLPSPHTDSIFAITVEELGFFRASLVILAIGLLSYRGYQIAFRAADGFGRMLAFGITTWLLLQTMMNIASILGLMPLTGVPLPFISYGGTSLVVSLAAVGVIINISKASYGR